MSTMLQTANTVKRYEVHSPIDFVNYAHNSLHLDLFAEQIK